MVPSGHRHLPGNLHTGWGFWALFWPEHDKGCSLGGGLAQLLRTMACHSQQRLAEPLSLKQVSGSSSSVALLSKTVAVAAAAAAVAVALALALQSIVV